MSYLRVHVTMFVFICYAIYFIALNIYSYQHGFVEHYFTADIVFFFMVGFANFFYRKLEYKEIRIFASLFITYFLSFVLGWSLIVFHYGTNRFNDPYSYLIIIICFIIHTFVFIVSYIVTRFLIKVYD